MISGDVPCVPLRRPAWPRLFVPLSLLMVALPAWVGCDGCSNSSTPVGGGGPTQDEIVGQYEGELLSYAIDNLNQLENFDTGSVLPQIIDRLNQWAQTQEMPADWTLDPLLETLPKQLAEPLATVPAVEDLDKPEFALHDGAALQEAIWLRDLATWVAGDQTDDVARAKRLFDWTVRNIEMRPRFLAMPDGRQALVRQMPWETLLLGQGTSLDRAWVFILLSRQLGLDVALLAIPDSPNPEEPNEERPKEETAAEATPNEATPNEESPNAASPEDAKSNEEDASEQNAEQPPARTWVAALNSGGQLYLFEPVLGVPIPAPDGIRLDADGQLDIQPATLAEATNDPNVLGRLNIDDEDRYPVTAADLKQVEVLLEASPAYLARRMKLLESRLAGKKKVVLTTDATAQAERWKAHPQIAQARLWPVPYATILQQTIEDPQLRGQLLHQRLAALAPFQMVADAVLWKGRVRHLKGTLIGEKSATYYYQSARTSDENLQEAQRMILAKHYEAVKQSQEAAKMTEDQIRTMARQEAAVELTMLLRAKQNASYWMGLVAYERDTDSSLDSAIDYFTKRTLDATPDGPWTHAAKYNLARTYEAKGETEKAIERYQLDTTSPSYFGNLLRARWLKSLQPGGDTPEPGTTAEPPDVVTPEPTVEMPEPSVETPEPSVETPEPAIETPELDDTVP